MIAGIKALAATADYTYFPSYEHRTQTASPLEISISDSRQTPATAIRSCQAPAHVDDGSAVGAYAPSQFQFHLRRQHIDKSQDSVLRRQAHASHQMRCALTFRGTAHICIEP